MEEINYNKMNKCGTNMKILISLDKRAQEDLKNDTHGIGQEEVITIIREFIRLQNDYIALKEQISFLEAKMENYGCGFDEYDSDF